MSDEPEDPRSEWDPLGWELEGPAEQSSNLPTPRAVEVVASVPTGNPPRQSRNPAVVMLVASVLLAVLGLVGIGIGVGSIFFNQDTPPPEIVVVPGPQVVSAPPDQSPPVQIPLTVSPSDGTTGLGQPLSQSDPVVEVARAVIPSVVLIEVVVDGLEPEIPEFPDLEPDIPDFESEVPDFESEIPEEGPRFGQGSGIIYDASG